MGRYWKDFKIIWLSSSFDIFTVTNGEEKHHCQKDFEDENCRKVIGELKEKYETHYKALLIMGEKFEDYLSEFDEIIVLANIKRVLREFESPLKDYRNYPRWCQRRELVHNLEELDRMAAFVSSAKYAINGMEVTSLYSILIHTDRGFPSHITVTREDISAAEENIDNHISRNEHILTSFSICLAIIIAIVSLLLSVIMSLHLMKKSNVFQRELLQKTDGIDRRMQFLRKEFEKTQEDLHSRKKLKSKYSRS